MVEVAFALNALSLLEVPAIWASNSDAFAFLHGVELRADDSDTFVVSEEESFWAASLDALFTFKLRSSWTAFSDALVFNLLLSFTALLELVAETVLEDHV